MYANVPFRPIVYTETFSYKASYKKDAIRKRYTVDIVPFSYKNISIPFTPANNNASKQMHMEMKLF